MIVVAGYSVQSKAMSIHFSLSVWEPVPFW